jgi:hypothetical protein
VAAPTIRNHWTNSTAPAATASAPDTDSAPTTPAKAKHTAHRATAARDTMTTKKETGKVNIVAVSVWQPELRDRVKKVLNPGARLELAAEDFTSAEEFVTVAHAARNTQVPFVVLKDRVLNHGQSLADAIHEFKPDVNAKAEVKRARTEARADLDIAS